MHELNPILRVLLWATAAVVITAVVLAFWALHAGIVLFVLVQVYDLPLNGIPSVDWLLEHGGVTIAAVLLGFMLMLLHILIEGIAGSK